MKQPPPEFTQEAGLPRVLVLSNGEIDVRMFKEILALQSSPAKKIRSLFADVRNERMTPITDVVKRLAEEAQFPKFRSEWAKWADSKRPSLPPLGHLAVEWAVQASQHKIQHPLKIEGLFVKRKKQFGSKLHELHFPQLDKIHLLVAAFSPIVKGDLRIAALYCWGLIEKIENSARTQPTEPSLRNFKNTLLSSLSAPLYAPLLEQLKAVPPIESQSPTPNRISESPTRSIEPKSHPPANCPRETNTEFFGVRQLSAEIAEAKYNHKQQLTRSGLALQEAAPDLDSIISNLKDARNCELSIREKRTLLAAELEKIFNGSLTRFNASVSASIFLAVDKEEAILINESQQLLESIRGISVPTERVGGNLSVGESVPLLTFGSVRLFLEETTRRMAALTAGAAAQKELFQIAVQNFSNFNWDAFAHKAISRSSWEHIANFHAANGQLNLTCAIAFRAAEARPSNELITLILDELKKPERLANAIKFLGCLTLGQVEKFAGEHSELEDAATIAQFSAFTMLPPADSFDIWSAYPINNTTARSLNSPFNDFFFYSYGLLSSNIEYAPKRLKKIAKIGLLQSHRKSRTPSRQIKEIIRTSGLLGAIGKLTNTVFARLFAQIARAGDDNELLKNAIEALPPTASSVIEALQFERGEPIREDYLQKISAAVQAAREELIDWLVFYDLNQETKSIGRLDEKENALIATVKQMGRSESSRDKLLRRWLDVFVTEPLADFSIWALDRSRSSNWEANAKFETNPRFPRAYLTSSKGGQVTCGMLATDLLLNEFDLLNPVDIANAYVDQGFYEAYQNLSKIASSEIPFDVDRELDVRIEQHSKKQNERFAELRGQFESLWPNEPYDDLERCRDLLQAEKWQEAQNALGELALRITQETERQRIEAELKCLREEISDYGGTIDGAESSSELRGRRDALCKATSGQRAHLEHILRLAEIKTNGEVASLATASYMRLRKTSELPELENADIVALLFSEVFDALSEQLRRSKNFLPQYSTRLVELSAIVLDATLAPSSVANTESRFLKMLERQCSRFSAIAETDLASIESLLDDVKTDLGLSKIRTAFEPKPVGDTLPIVMSGSDQLANEIALESQKHLDDFVHHAKEDSALTEDEILTDFVKELRQKKRISLEKHTALLALATARDQSTTVRNLLPTRNSKGSAWELVSKFLTRLAQEDSGADREKSLAESVEFLSARPESARQAHEFARLAFGLVSHVRPGPIKWLWEGLSGDSKQAEIRADILSFLAQCGLSRALTYCLSAGPIEFNDKKAEALALAAVNIHRENTGQIARTFVELRKTSGSRVFNLFADRIASLPPSTTLETSNLSVVGDLQRVSETGETYQATLRVVPNTSDWPQSIEITFPPVSPVRAGDGSRVLRVEGPFVAETTISVPLKIEDANATHFTTLAECHATSISGVRTAFSTNLSISISGAAPFEAATPATITAAFDNFPSQQMRGDSYVPRIDDEQRIEKALIRSNAVRSIWIASPRRSGKTSMLYRILDSYSHKAQRDIAICYFTIDVTFSSAPEFNGWIWKKMVTGDANRELRNLYTDFPSLGRDLPFDADCGTFFSALSDKLLSASSIVLTRAIFLVDEVDRFASMHFEGGHKREAARDIVWQLRNMVGLRKDIGFIFAGSSAAKRIFVTDPESPFFNSISLLDLIPFSTKTKSDEEYSRMIVEPVSLRSRYHFPRETLEHLIWICSGIPYYMKLLAGATMAVARQRYLLRSDVNTGLQAMLAKKTGIEELDELGGDPGSDELRAMALEIDEDKTLARAVLYAVAEMQSPVSGQRLQRGRVLGADSPLVMRYRLSKEQINRGLKIAIDLGLLTLTPDEFPQVYFSIPLLGESLRAAKGRNWAAIDHNLLQLEGAP